MDQARVHSAAEEQLQQDVSDLRAELSQMDDREVTLAGEMRASLDREAERAFAAQLVKLQEAEAQVILSLPCALNTGYLPRH